jgi:ribosomal small subunit protein bTHX
MGKGDMRTKKGKRYRGTFGKSRPKKKKTQPALKPRKRA